MQIIEAQGRSLKASREAEQVLHKLEIYRDGGDWVVKYHSSAHDKNPGSHRFEDGFEFLRHVAECSGVPSPDDSEQ